jgi:hypothetical protein
MSVCVCVCVCWTRRFVFISDFGSTDNCQLNCYKLAMERKLRGKGVPTGSTCCRCRANSTGPSPSETNSCSATQEIPQHHKSKTNWAVRRHQDVWGSECMDPYILDLDTSWMRVVSFTPRPLYPRGKSLRYKLDTRKIFPYRDSKSDPSAVQPVASRYLSYFPTSYETQRFITVFTRGRYCVRWIQPISHILYLQDPF